RFATAFRGVDGRAKLQSGEWIAIFGCGGVGLSSIMIAKALGARVIAVDVNEGALEKAKTAGAEFTINSRNIEPTEKIKEITGGGAHVGIDALGSEGTASQSIMSLRRRGRHVQIGLLLPVDQNSRIPMQRALSYELDLFGSHGMSAMDYPKMLMMISESQLNPESLIERTISLEEAAKELPLLDTALITGITIIKP
ncbi:MAG: zinc-binding dehydrogenase, partial [Actinobacteria bacterium]|nr:zinc-binding dehydrogenase [Actinomycetota bacterium]